MSEAVTTQLFGQTAIELGLITKHDLEHALLKQREFFQIGLGNQLLGAVLVQLGKLTPQQVGEVVRVTGATLRGDSRPWYRPDPKAFPGEPPRAPKPRESVRRERATASAKRRPLHAPAASGLPRTLFGEDHDLYRDAVRRFLREEIAPHQEAWRERGIVSRTAWERAGDAGLLCPWLSVEHGGAGGDLLHSLVVIEELARVYESGFAISLHSDIVVPYLDAFGTREQKERWLPGCAAGTLITALAMTEPNAGSDVARLHTRAVREGDHYVLDGQKTFISNGILSDLVIVAARTDLEASDPRRGLSLIVVERDTPGFVRGKRLQKMGMASQDTSELYFEGCRVPVTNRLGLEGAGFSMMMQNLAQERLVVAASAQAQAEQVLEDTVAYVNEREAFGRPIGKLQNTRFVLADCAAEVGVGRAYIDQAFAALAADPGPGGTLAKACSIAKLWHTEMLFRVCDRCLQLFGGYGYMTEYPVTRAFMDARVQRIFAGTNEIMKVLIAKELGL